MLKHSHPPRSSPHPSLSERGGGAGKGTKRPATPTRSVGGASAFLCVARKKIYIYVRHIHIFFTLEAQRSTGLEGRRLGVRGRSGFLTL